MKRIKKTILISFLSLCLAALLCVSALTASIISYGRVDEKREADVIIVLGAGIWDGEVAPVFRERINHGIWLFENGYAEYIIFTGGVSEGETVSEAMAAKKYASEKGVPAENILIEESSRITEQNLKNAKALMDEKGFKTAIVVSDPLHMKRAMLMASDFGIEAYSSPTPTSMYKSWKTKLPFLAREEFYYIGYYVLRPFRNR